MDPLTQTLMMKQQGQPQQGAPSPPGQGQPPMDGGMPPSPMLQQLLGGMGQGQPSPPQQLPMGPPPPASPQAGPPPTPIVPPNPPTRVPQQVKRFNNAQQIQNSIRNNWTPNPTLLRATLGNK